MYKITAFPAADGDCFLLSYGEAPPHRHILIDGGRRSTYTALKPALKVIALAGEAINLMVLSHIDADHIEGFLQLVEDQDLSVKIHEVWYNGFDQMSAIEPLGPAQGDRFSTALRKSKWKWNERFNGKAVVAAPTPIEIEGLSLTLLSPNAEKLKAMRNEWLKWRTKKASLAETTTRLRRSLPPGIEVYGPRPMPSHLNITNLAKKVSDTDKEEPNGSSISFIAEYKEQRILLTGDAHPDILEDALTPLASAEGGRYRIDAIKVSHHGSRANTTQKLIELVKCNHFLISTSGAIHGHPDPEVIAKILHFSPSVCTRHLYFNYRSPWTIPWGNAELARANNYKAHYPESDGLLTLDISQISR